MFIIGSADAGKIAAGILVPFFIILGGVILVQLCTIIGRKAKKTMCKLLLLIVIEYQYIPTHGAALD